MEPIKHLRAVDSPTIFKMVGRDNLRRNYILDKVLTETQINYILRQATNNSDYEFICGDIRPAADGLCGYLGDHMKAVLHVKVKEDVRKVHLFVKALPDWNKPKADFLRNNNFFKREKLMIQILDEIDEDKGPNPWYAKAYICTESLLVMPDLSVQGYREHPLLQTLDLQHVLLTISAVARYHAAFAKYQTKKTITSSHAYNFYQEHQHILVEPTFKETPWIRTAAKSAADLLDAFSTKHTKTVIPDLELKLSKSFIDACNSFVVAEDSLNVLTHRDLWNNNILFKYDQAVPTNAMLIDYQCLRYGPPAFDVTSFLYLTTSRRFRAEHEADVFKYYFQVFSDSLDDVTRKALEAIGYDEKEFVCWCERSRMFGLVEAVAIGPQVLMDPKTGEEVFSNPDTFMTIVEVDRSGPVLEYARNNPLYKERQLEFVEEYVERFILGDSSTL